MKIALVLPVYNEGEMLPRVLKVLLKYKIPIILVDDGSSDNTAKIAEKEALKNPRLQIITHKINLGKGAALKTACVAAFSNDIEAVIFMDADGQHSPLDLEKFIEKLKTKKYDVVLGSRNLDKDVPLIRLLGNKIASVVISLLFGVYVSDILCGFRGITKKGFKKINLESPGYGVETEMVVKISKYKLRFCEVPIKTIYYDKNKGVTFIDAINVFFNVLKWRVIL